MELLLSRHATKKALHGSVAFFKNESQAAQADEKEQWQYGSKKQPGFQLLFNQKAMSVFCCGYPENRAFLGSIAVDYFVFFYPSFFIWQSRFHRAVCSFCSDLCCIIANWLFAGIRF